MKQEGKFTPLSPVDENLRILKSTSTDTCYISGEKIEKADGTLVKYNEKDVFVHKRFVK
jgi:hypothetical protein